MDIVAMALPDSVTQKVRWSKHHLNLIRAARDRYFNDPSYEMAVDTGGHAHAVIAPPIPWELPHITGDAIQNTRAALDYLVRELGIVAHADAPEDNAFVIRPTSAAFQKARKRMAGLSPEMIAEIERFQPYNCGDKWKRSYLWVLNELSNLSKHRRIILTQIWVTNIGPGDIARPIGRYQTQLSDVVMQDELMASIAFQEGILAGEDVCLSVRHMIDYIEIYVLPAFEKFFDSSHISLSAEA